MSESLMSLPLPLGAVVIYIIICCGLCLYAGYLIGRKLSTGDPGKVIKGADMDTGFDNIALEIEDEFNENSKH